MKIVYLKATGEIEAVLEDWQNKEVYFTHYPEEFKNSLDEIQLEELPDDLENYMVKNKELVKLSDEEIAETRQFGKILTEEERLLNKLKPSYEEIKKAEQTIEILTLIKEVM